MADARVCEVHEDLAWAWLWSVELDDFGGDFAWLIVDDGFVLLWDLWSGHCEISRRCEVLGELVGLQLHKNWYVEEKNQKV